jgi:Domain of unknown function (DUF5666)
VTFDQNRPVAPQPYSPATLEPSSAPPSVSTAPVMATQPVFAAPPAGPVARKTSSGGRWLNLILVLAAAVAIGGVAFAVGRTTAPAPASAVGNGRTGFGPGGSFAPRGSGAPGLGRGGFGGAGLTINGTVQSVTADTLTVKTAAGQTVVVALGASTTYDTQTAASATDVQAGKTVQVQLDFSGQGRPAASATTSGPVGTASSVTVVP